MQSCSEGDGPTVHDAVTERLIMALDLSGNKLSWVADHVRNRQNHTMQQGIPPMERLGMNTLIGGNRKFLKTES